MTHRRLRMHTVGDLPAGARGRHCGTYACQRRHFRMALPMNGMRRSVCLCLGPSYRQRMAKRTRPRPTAVGRWTGCVAYGPAPARLPPKGEPDVVAARAVAYRALPRLDWGSVRSGGRFERQPIPSHHHRGRAANRSVLNQTPHAIVATNGIHRLDVGAAAHARKFLSLFRCLPTFVFANAEPTTTRSWRPRRQPWRES
jgi:hypothetical protein